MDTTVVVLINVEIIKRDGTMLIAFILNIQTMGTRGPNLRHLQDLDVRGHKQALWENTMENARRLLIVGMGTAPYTFGPAPPHTIIGTKKNVPPLATIALVVHVL